MSLPRPAPDRTAVVTGASSGIGASIARELASRGYGVTLVARRADKLEDLAQEIRARGVRAEVLAADLSDRSARAELLGRITELGLIPDILINNAGLSTLGPVAESDPAAEMNMIEVDVVAVADLCTRFLPGMVERRRGALLNVASTAAFQPLPGQAGYGACKAFVLSYTQSLTGELRGTGVTATALCPGPVHTGFGEAAGFAKDDAEKALPPIMWVEADTVAKTAVDDMTKGRMVSIPGAANRIGSIFAQITPRTVLVPMLTRIHPGLGKNARKGASS
ncbi:MULTISPECIES: SDR family NAD(P)-dependent oxidoreductase [Rhodococcus]|uniref:SDR family oxidoreductase n=1 Tax=Rhodococcus cerastii TaxID=908616 RepID=A0ABU4D676_9NOCA|nr:MULTISPECIES: SDR family oxidoreductase [Rhodococcus]KAA0922513.1 SDR family oxidoreductase [Rhodococcus sp. ANT_H53B]MDV6305208.1 SDR family oxidoreductase [Rhodococcus cerastii]MDV7990973.1 SDR family oxidoreductase [Rhodococcus sp. IEGM 1374]MDV8057325.1 SDR family oxidoreductase [Rhodococcus sp. IEGM 1343]MDV8078213.1 SDR family oxidoreductase [Rhodococcus sp. IEGM 1370]